MHELLITVVGGIILILLPFVCKWIARQWRTFNYNRFLHSEAELNAKIADIDFKNFEKTEQLNGSKLHSWYKDDMRRMTIHDANGVRTVELPYLEIIDFIKHPDTEIHIRNSEDHPLTITKKFMMSPDIIAATQDVLEDVCRRKPSTHNDPHPRLASLERIDRLNYRCSFEEAKYFQQIRTNLTMDKKIEIGGHVTTMRQMEQERMGSHSGRQGKGGLLNQMMEVVYRKLGKERDYGIEPRTLPMLSESRLANVIGVSAIWCMGDVRHPKFYLLPRKKEVGVYENKLGMPSGDIECPRNDHFPSDSLVDYLKWEIAREFAEETGIADSTKDFDLYSKPLDAKKVQHRTRLEIIPLAFLREMLRGGKPQMFFLIKTEEIPGDILRKCFRKSQGTQEFSRKAVTRATLSTEVACNYLYAQAYLNPTHNGVIDVN